MVTDAPPRNSHQATGRPRRSLRQATGRVLPTLATLGNLICGMAAIWYAAKGCMPRWATPSEYALDTYRITYFTIAGWLVFLAMVFDGLDGRLARLTRSTSDLGAQLDSLADVISFGLAPAMLVLMVLAMRIRGGLFQDQWIDEGGRIFVGRTIWVIGAIFASCAALRLARFNVETTADESAHMWFKGLPSPGAAAAIASLVILMEEFHRADSSSWMVETLFWTLPPATLVCGLLMVSNVPYPHATNHFIRGRHPFRNLVAAMLAVALLLVLKQKLVALISVGYLLAGPSVGAYRRLFGKDTRSVDDLAAEVVEEEDEDGDEPNGASDAG
ncbi:MAG: phosphatidylcholine/phosphatidylserine synthase [Phycisphaerae bacterium]|nr:phosphatidylcholine/phosphatidylserine synthase [Phycisphaerae bacterium]